MNPDNLMSLPTPVANLQQYVQLIHNFPTLDADEEVTLAKRWHSDNDRYAAWRLVTSNLRYVINIARSYQGYGFVQDDLIQEGNIGLMKAVQRFDPMRGVRLMAYATHWIRAEILEFVLKNWRIVNVATTKAKRKLFFKLRSAKQRLEWLNNEEAQQIADELNVDAGDVVSVDARLYSTDDSFDEPVEGGSELRPAPAAYLADADIEPETIVSESKFYSNASRALRTALLTLDSRSREIIQHRWLYDTNEKLTLQALGERYGVSAERIRQLEANAIQRLRESLLP